MQNKYKGLLISFDGLDSTGKFTQTKLLVNRLRYHGRTVAEFATPDYNTPSGKEIKLRFQNKIGNWEQTPWQEKLQYFAKNRAEHRREVLSALKSGAVVVYDRYIPSSLAFITVEALSPEEVGEGRLEVHQAIEKQEYFNNKMPAFDLSIFLDVPPRLAAELLDYRKKTGQDEDEYTDHLIVQERLYKEYDIMCQEKPEQFSRIACVVDGQLLGKEDTAECIWQDLIHRFPDILEKNSR